MEIDVHLQRTHRVMVGRTEFKRSRVNGISISWQGLLARRSLPHIHIHILRCLISLFVFLVLTYTIVLHSTIPSPRPSR